MPTFENGTSLATVRSRLNTAIIDAELGRGSITTVAGLIADTSMGYTTAAARYVTAGQRLTIAGFDYEVAASGASDHHVTTAGGVKLYVLPGPDGVVNVKAFGATGTGENASTYYAAADDVCGDGGTIYFPAGTYLLDYQTISANRRIIGDQWLTIIKPLTTDTRAALTCDSGSASAFVDNVTIKHLTFKSMDTPTFSEQDHLITINGASNWTIEDCQFIGWRGDAIYIGSSDSGGSTERHNKNITIRGCFFDGINRENRQAISVIDIDGIWIENNVFQNNTRTNMPGTIDFEPDAAAFHIIRNIWITNNKFKSCGGNVGTITVYVQPTVTEDPYNLNIIGNEVSDPRNVSASGALFTFYLLSRTPTATSDRHVVRVVGNKVTGDGTGAYGPFSLLNGKDVEMRGNVYQDIPLQANVGLNTGETALDVKICDTFTRVGADGAYGVTVFNASGVDFSGSVFDDCGDGLTNSHAIQFNTGASDRVKINGVRIVSPTGKTLQGIIKEAGHTLSPSTNEFFNNDIGSFSNTFQAHQSDTIWTSYTPTVEGTTSAGTGTYTEQFGRYMKRGKQVTFQAKVAMSGHTGTGMIELALPTPVYPATSNAETTIAVSADGVSTTGGQIGWINPAALVGSNGCVRFYHTATGTLAQTTIPGGAFTVWASGVYLEA